MKRLLPFALALLAAAPPAEVPAPPAVVAQLQRMNDADCANSKHQDWDPYVKTLASEYVDIEADGSRTSRAEVVAGLKTIPKDDVVLGCSTAVSKVVRSGDRYRLYGTYAQDGIQGAKRIHYHLVSRIRDTWKNVDGRWLQTESLSYEQTISVDGKAISHTGHAPG